jgi:hypothetical protein
MPRPKLGTPNKQHVPSPYSRAFRRGAVGDLDARTRTGRYMRNAEQELCRHLGVETIDQLPVTKRILVHRVVRCLLQLEAFDTKFAGDTWTDLDCRTYAGLIGRVERLMRTIGIDPVAAKPKRQTLADLRGAA